MINYLLLSLFLFFRLLCFWVRASKTTNCWLFRNRFSREMVLHRWKAFRPKLRKINIRWSRQKAGLSMRSSDSAYTKKADYKWRDISFLKPYTSGSTYMMMVSFKVGIKAIHLEMAGIRKKLQKRWFVFIRVC